MSSGSFFLIKIPGLEMNLGQYSGTQTVWSVDDEMDDDTGGATRSYTCAFCKRGFSNAQALGGHMNIHRKDRAKLKEAADDRYHNQTLLSLDISREDITAASPSSTSPRRQQSEDSLGSNNSHHHHQHQHQQPLFVDHPVAEKEREQLLDLELRLGPEPQPPTPDL